MWPSWWLDGVRLAGVPVPAPTRRLAFREMTPDDLDNMAALLGDPQVMRYYPHPKSREEALAWIAWNQRLYREHGVGLWLLTLRATGEFVGDCAWGADIQSHACELQVSDTARLATVALPSPHRRGPRCCRSSPP